MNNQILDTIELSNDVFITLEIRQSKNNRFYNCVVLASANYEIVLSFDVNMFNKIKRTIYKLKI